MLNCALRGAPRLGSCDQCSVDARRVRLEAVESVLVVELPLLGKV